MKRYLIEDAKCGITGGGMACGPVCGNVAVSVHYRDGEQNGWLTVVEVDGIPNAFRTDADIFDKVLAEDPDDEAFTWYLRSHCIHSFDGVELDGDYADTFESMARGAGEAAAPLVRYVIALVRCSMEEVEGLIAMARNRFADELTIPVSDVEEEYLMDMENEE
jgi:hypothetical protein